MVLFSKHPCQFSFIPLYLYLHQPQLTNSIVSRNYKKSKDKVNHYFRIDARPAKANCLFEKSVYEIQESIKKTRIKLLSCLKGDVLEEVFDINTAIGLSEAKAAELLEKVGYNELPSAKPRSIFAIALEVLKEPMFLLLVAGGLIYLLLGDIQEALILLAFVFVVMGITLYQERKTERALEALRDLSSPRALVIRDGVHQTHRWAGGRSRRPDLFIGRRPCSSRCRASLLHKPLCRRVPTNR